MMQLRNIWRLVDKKLMEIFQNASNICLSDDQRDLFHRSGIINNNYFLICFSKTGIIY